MSVTQTVRRARLAAPRPAAVMPEPASQRRPLMPLVLTAACVVLFLVVLVAR